MGIGFLMSEREAITSSGERGHTPGIQSRINICPYVKHTKEGVACSNPRRPRGLISTEYCEGCDSYTGGKND